VRTYEVELGRSSTGSRSSTCSSTCSTARS